MRVPLRRPKLPFRRSKDGAATQPTEAQAATAPSPGTPAKPDAAAKAKAAQLSGDPHERLDGLRAWLAQVDRKLGVRSYAGGAAVVLALAAGIVGVVLALNAKDESASKEDLQALSEEIATIGDRAAAAAEEGVQTLADRLDSLEGRVSQIQSGQRTTERELSVVQDDIDDLRSQISGLDGGAGSSGAGTSGAGTDSPATPDIPDIPDLGGANP